MEPYCPANPEWWKSEVFRPFYLEKITPGDPDVRVGGAEELKMLKNGHAIWGGRDWISAPIRVAWNRGPIRSSPDGFNVDHWHTDIAIPGHDVHVDYVSYMRGGPRTGYREYRVFVDQNEFARGGGFMGFLGINFARLRNWPLAVILDDYLLYSDKMLQWWPRSEVGVIDPNAGFSVWKKHDLEAGNN